MSAKRILACDIGLKRIGLAIFTQGIILPISPILRKNRNQASNALSQILKERHIEILVVGMPSGDQETHEMQKRIRHFISLIEFEGEVVFVNEDLSSKIAQENLLELTKKERSEKIKNGELDSLSAMEILKRFIQKN